MKNTSFCCHVLKEQNNFIQHRQTTWFHHSCSLSSSLDVLEICKSKRLKQNDLREFDKHMERLMKMDTFSVDGDGYTDSLLVV